MPINRIVPTKRGKMAAASSIGAVALACTVLIQPWESLRLQAYLDKIARKPVWTICYGETKDVKKGDRATEEECDQRLKVRVERDFYKPLTVCIPGFEQKPVTWQAAMIDLAWNVGVGATCDSTAADLARNNQIGQSCLALTAFNKAGKDRHVVKGLVKRRETGDAERIGEAELCVSGLH